MSQCSPHPIPCKYWSVLMCVQCAMQMLAPVVMAAAVQGGAGAGGAAQAALSHLALTHDSRKLQGYAQV